MFALPSQLALATHLTHMQTRTRIRTSSISHPFPRTRVLAQITQPPKNNQQRLEQLAKTLPQWMTDDPPKKMDTIRSYLYNSTAAALPVVVYAIVVVQRSGHVLQLFCLIGCFHLAMVLPYLYGATAPLQLCHYNSINDAFISALHRLTEGPTFIYYFYLLSEGPTFIY